MSSLHLFGHDNGKGKLLSHQQSQENESCASFWGVFSLGSILLSTSHSAKHENVAHKFQTSSEHSHTWLEALHFVDTDIQLLRQMNHPGNK